MPNNDKEPQNIQNNNESNTLESTQVVAAATEALIAAAVAGSKSAPTANNKESGSNDAEKQRADAKATSAGKNISYLPDRKIICLLKVPKLCLKVR